MVWGNCLRLISHHQSLGEYEGRADRVARLSFTEMGPQTLPGN